MTRHNRYLFALTLARWGFAAMVAAAIAIGLVVAITASPPTDIPAVALRSVAVYRAEAGTTVFLGLYIATMAFILALHHRAFTEIGSAGVRAQGLATISEDAISEAVAAELLEEVMGEVRDLRNWRKESQSAH
jgi:hypothetical protein